MLPDSTQRGLAAPSRGRKSFYLREFLLTSTHAPEGRCRRAEVAHGFSVQTLHLLGVLRLDCSSENPAPFKIPPKACRGHTFRWSSPTPRRVRLIRLGEEEVSTLANFPAPRSGLQIIER